VCKERTKYISVTGLNFVVSAEHNKLFGSYGKIYKEKVSRERRLEDLGAEDLPCGRELMMMMMMINLSFRVFMFSKDKLF